MVNGCSVIHQGCTVFGDSLDRVKVFGWSVTVKGEREICIKNYASVHLIQESYYLLR